MYDYEKDPLETENIVDIPEYSTDKKKLQEIFMKAIQKDFKSCAEYSKTADYHTPIKTGSDSE
jgi:hypothetical protein